MRRLRASVLRKFREELETEPERFCFVIDDTANHKSGKNMFRVDRWGTSGGVVYTGQKVFVIGLVDSRKGVAFPLGYRICSKEKTGHELSLELLDEVLDAGFPKLTLAADMWFDSADFFSKLLERAVDFVIHIRDRRVAKENPGPLVRWQHLAEFFKETEKIVSMVPAPEGKTTRRKKKFCSEKIGYIKNLARQLKLVAVYNHKKDKAPFAIYASSRKDLTETAIWAVSRFRWRIEEMFRSLRQDLSFGKLPCHGKAGADVSICVPFIIWTSLHLHPEEWAEEYSTVATAGTIIKKAREKNFETTLQTISHRTENPSIARLLARRDRTRMNKKPVDMLADKKGASSMRAKP